MDGRVRRRLDYEGAWKQGARVRFLGPSGDGMVAEAAKCRPPEFLSLKHLGFVKDGVEDTQSEMVEAGRRHSRGHAGGCGPVHASAD